MILTLTQPGKSGQSLQTSLHIKESVNGLIHQVGRLSIDLMSEPATLVVQPHALGEFLLNRQVLISVLGENGQLTVFCDRMAGFDGLSLRLQGRGLVPVDSIRELVLLKEDDGPAARCASETPLPLLPMPGVAVADLPQFLSKVCIVWYQNGNGDIKVFTDRLHAWFDDTMWFRNHHPILLQYIRHILPLEERLSSLCTVSALPEYDAEMIDCSIL